MKLFPSIHGWHHIIILSNVKAEKTPVVSQFTKKTKFKKLKVVEKKLEKQEKKSF